MNDALMGSVLKWNSPSFDGF